MKSGNTLKNVKLVKILLNGHDNWKLFHIDVNGREWEDPFFNFFAEYLLPGEGSGSDSRNTRYNYTHRVAHFADFMIEAVNYEVEHGQHEMNGALLARLMRRYPKFLAEAKESGDSLVAEVARRLNATPCSRSSQSMYLAAVNKYLDLSEDFNAMMRELGIHSINGTPLYSEVDLFPEAFGQTTLSNKERIALNKNSMLAGVMSGGAKLKRIAKLKPLKRVVKREAEQGIDLEEFYQHDHFPFEYAPRLIVEGFTSLRNKVLFCLLMACGCRFHEALLLTWRDIDTARQLVRLRCPHDKSLEDFSGFFRNMSQILALPWKGRLTERTALIEPFRSHFWRLLAEYPKGMDYICGVVALLSTLMVAPHIFDLWAVAIAAILVLCAIAFRSIHAVHLSFFGLFWIALPSLVTVFRPWPVCMIVPLVVYGILVATCPSLRHSFGWLRRGSLGPDILKLILATIVISGTALIIWYLAMRPDTRHLLRFMPPMPFWLYPLAGLGFAMGNAALEEAIFRGVIMDALDSAFGPGRASILLQAVPFALLHFHGGFPSGWWGLAMVFIYGLMLGITRRRSQGMLAPWLAHVGADSVIFVILAWIVLR